MSYLRKSSFDRSPSNRYIELAADPSIAMYRASIAVAGVAADAPHICGGPLTLRFTLLRENKFHRKREPPVALSISPLPPESFSPQGWIAALPSASTAKPAAGGAGREKTRGRAPARSGGPGGPPLGA